MRAISRNCVLDGCADGSPNPPNRPNFAALPQVSGTVRPGRPGVRNLTRAEQCLTMAGAAATAHASPVPLILLTLGAAAVWVIRLWWWPYAKCRRCEGSGRNTGSTGRRFGTCRKCEGSGRRQRLGSELVRRIFGKKG
jgi:hypothetical protein